MKFVLDCVNVEFGMQWKIDLMPKSVLNSNLPFFDIWFFNTNNNIIKR